METHGFFGWVWRFNALVIAAAASLGALVAAYAMLEIVRDVTATRQVGAVVDPEAAAEDSETIERLGQFRPLGAGGLIWAPLERSTTTALAYRSKEAYGVADYLIYDPRSGASRYLVTTRPSYVLAADMLRARDAEGRATGPDLALYAHYVDADSDGDGRLTERDAQKVALARPDGTGLVAIATVRQVLSAQTIDAATALLMVEQEDGVGALHVRLSDGAVTRRDAIRP